MICVYELSMARKYSYVVTLDMGYKAMTQPTTFVIYCKYMSFTDEDTIHYDVTMTTHLFHNTFTGKFHNSYMTVLFNHRNKLFTNEHQFSSEIPKMKYVNT